MNILDHAITAIDKKNGLDNRHWDLAVAVRSILNHKQMSAADKVEAIDRIVPPALR